MRVLFAIPHYFQPTGTAAADGKMHGSTMRDAQPRIDALRSCLLHLHQQFTKTHAMIDHSRKIAQRVQPMIACQADVVVCTTRGCHVLDQLALPDNYFTPKTTNAEPMLLGFECHAVLRERLGHYDYYCYLEDDLIVHDPWLFVKLAWFNSDAGDDRLLLPNRFEAGPGGLVRKVYVDGTMRDAVTAPFRTLRDSDRLTVPFLGQGVVVEPARNPHAGCFFLNARQMAHWAAQPWFLDRDTRFIGPLESAATLGILKTFNIYKPALENGDFLEVQHHGTDYLNMLCLP